MANIDPKVASLVDRRADESEDEDALIAELEDSDNEPSGLRERRIQQLHAEFAHAKALRNQDHGSYATVASEKEVLDITTTAKLSLVHFFKPDFKRCQIMDAHLKELAERHVDTRIIRADVENMPWLVTKLQVQVLPCLIAFVDGKSVDRIVGFEGVGRGTDAITTSQLERRLVACGVLVREKMEGSADGGRKYNGLLNDSRATRVEEDSDDDWD